MRGILEYITNELTTGKYIDMSTWLFTFEVIPNTSDEKVFISAYGQTLDEAMEKIEEIGLNLPDRMDRYLIEAFEVVEETYINEQR